MRITSLQRDHARRDRSLLNALETAVGLLRKASDVYEVAETLGTLTDVQHEQLRKLRTAARSRVHAALDHERGPGEPSYSSNTVGPRA